MADAARGFEKLLAGKRALVTGGSRGLGRALSRVFAEEGARVAFTYTKDEPTAAGARADIEARGVEARAYRVDVRDVPATEAMVQDIEEAWGAIDVLVNNAGVSQYLPLAFLEAEDFEQLMSINVTGTFLTSKAVLRGMIRRRSGVVLNMGSLAGVRMIQAPVHYCASKAAVVGLTEGLAKEVARHDVRVLCLAPGLLESGVARHVPDYRLADYLEHCALGRVGSFEEIAKLAAFLVSDSNRYMNGTTVLADGGI